MPPPPIGECAWPVSFFGSSAIIASVVIRRPATEAHPGSATDGLGRINDTLGVEIAVGAGLGIVSKLILAVLEDLHRR